ncbi:diadenylate cyclase CdaA [Geobacter sp. SVR]|uniref:diadenylate cyclase CdaA n=1 Tax=Geobacter sp. SVR TaxID=2495594 RepID=UPI00143F006E|nr:diadenylate cyclase CdaA [Geobacter sp. SVR]BCS54507.1 membrane protein [Geobacter sp. SVR]GCF87107.1 membrane protein [Geobacter sp. SVR]
MTIPPALTELSDTIVMTALVTGSALVIRRDVALRLLGVMAGLSLASLAARVTNVTPLVRVLDIVISSMPVILAVVFQSDLRRTLLALGKRSPSASEFDGDIETVEELLRALRELAEKRIGALIVLVRQISLDHIVHVGTQIDAKVTCELLNSIFLPYSPIHDGAVIIEKGKLTKAGCLLPLSQNPDIAKSFGTRHRAALGLSELSDSYVVVVSEETGKISFVHDAKITYDMDSGELRRMLKKALGVRRMT